MASGVIRTQTELMLKGKTCLVTGGSRGIGLAIARTFAQNNASVILLSRNRQNLDNAIKSLPQTTDSQVHRAIDFDVASHQLLTKDVTDVNLSDISVVVNSAGVTQTSLLHATSRDDIKSIINTNLFGTIFMTQSFIKPMIKKREGCFINLSSVLASRGLKGTSVYAASKGGIESFTRSMATELGPRGIRSNCMTLGLVDTTDMGTSVTEEMKNEFIKHTPSKSGLPTEHDIANAALLLATNKSINGSILKVDGGFV
jgi:3-oxoacyl-[acyl-carrier protein] reductase